MIPLAELYPDRSHDCVFGLDMYNIMALSQVTFNKHSDNVWHEVGNMRLFEACGMGACLLTDEGHNLGDLFEPDSEVVTYANVQDCVEKLKYLMDHPQERAAIALAGKRRVLAQHTWEKRCEEIDEHIQKML